MNSMEPYHECPGCLGEGALDFRNDDAMMQEHFTDAEIEAMKERGLNHPLGVIVCPRCEGTRLVPMDEYLDVVAVGRAVIDQIKARLEEEEKAGQQPD